MQSLEHGRVRRVSAKVMVACLIAGAGMPGSAWAQQSKSRRCLPCVEMTAVYPRIDNLYVGPHGTLPGPFPGEPGRACNIYASLTDADFGGGSYILEMGFSQGEMAAATYSVPAGEWPIKINLTEVILAQSGAVVNTTTHWSLLFYQGTPATGTLVDTFSSDGTILPHAQIPAGTNGINIQFMIDPQDPDQLIIQDNGTHQFSVAFRIDQHNNQTANPCTTAPPSNSNAFPVVDVSGVSSQANNWLYGLNCNLGSFNCPPLTPTGQGGPSAGWGAFSVLSFCRPSGDWVMRTKWSSVLNCTPGVGACCLPAGTCSVLAVADCQTQGGQYQGDGVSCAAANCVPQTGACCLANGTCIAGQTSSQCTGQGGTYQGTGTSCGNCPQPNGACCFSNGNCLNFTSANCTTAGGTWLGAGSACNGSACPTGACCLANGSCLTGVTSLACTSQGGTFRGVGTTCATQCPQPTGACCISNGSCLVLTQVDCGSIPGTTWAGAGTTCTAGICSQPCYANCDGSTVTPVLNALDFGCFLNKFAGGDTYANCDASTSAPTLNALDFGCFLNKYAAGCT